MTDREAWNQRELNLHTVHLQALAEEARSIANMPPGVGDEGMFGFYGYIFFPALQAAAQAQNGAVESMARFMEKRHAAMRQAASNYAATEAGNKELASRMIQGLEKK